LRVVFGTSEKRLTIEAPQGPVTDGLLVHFVGERVDDPGGPADLVVQAKGAGFEVHAGLDGTVESFQGVGPLLTELEFGVARFLLLRHRHQTHLHAAGAVAFDRQGQRRAILALGDSGAGKSTLALALSASGLPLLGDDIVLLDEQAMAARFRRLIHVEAAQAERLGAPARSIVRYPLSGSEVWYDPAAGAGWADLASVPAVVARIRWRPSTALSVRPLSTAQALELLLGSVLDSGETPAGSLHRFTEVVDRARMVDLEYGDAQEAAQALREMVAER
jgi:hypothetical protein